MRWFTSDLHLGHANIIRFCGRPFGSVPHMDGALVAALAGRVGPDDELWILGDLAMGGMDRTLPMLRAIAARRIVLVAGNHDRCHPMHGTHQAWAERYEREAGVEVIGGNTALDIAGHDVQVSHFPYAGRPGQDMPVVDSRAQGKGADRYAAYRPVDDGRWLLCGHVHEKWRQRSRSINVGVDAWAGQPVSEDDIASLIGEGPASRESLAWPEQAAA